MTKSDERAFNKILRAAGIILIIMSLLSIWRGIFRLIPFAGLKYGIIFSIVGGVFGLIGVILLVIAVRQSRKWKKDDEAS